jgi:hypothetical protein
MSKLKELVNRGVRLIVADVPEGSPPPPPAASELPPDAFSEVEPPRPVVRSEVAADVEDFGAVYQEAGIELPLHGYGVDKVAEMLASKHLQTLGREVRATAVLAALEAAQVDVKDVIEDGVRRDRALDAFEAAKQREVQELQAETGQRIQAIKEEIETFLKAKNAELEGLKKAEEGARESFGKLQARKRREEDRLFEVVANFVAGPNPITAGGTPAAAPSPAKPDPS